MLIGAVYAQHRCVLYFLGRFLFASTHFSVSQLLQAFRVGISCRLVIDFSFVSNNKSACAFDLTLTHFFLLLRCGCFHLILSRFLVFLCLCCFRFHSIGKLPNYYECNRAQSQSIYQFDQKITIHLRDHIWLDVTFYHVCIYALWFLNGFVCLPSMFSSLSLCLCLFSCHPSVSSCPPPFLFRSLPLLAP